MNIGQILKNAKLIFNVRLKKKSKIIFFTIFTKRFKHGCLLLSLIVLIKSPLHKIQPLILSMCNDKYSSQSFILS